MATFRSCRTINYALPSHCLKFDLGRPLTTFSWWVTPSKTTSPPPTPHPHDENERSLKPVFLRSYPDIRGAADILRHLTRACIEHVTSTSDPEHLIQVALPEILSGATYNGHVIDDHDWSVVKSMATSVCRSDTIEVKM